MLGPAARTHRFGGTLTSLLLRALLVGSAWLTSPWHRDIVALTQTYATLDPDQEQRLSALYNTDSRSLSGEKNLVVLYLESFESTYFDETLFPELLPRLRSLRQEAAYFSGIAQSPGAGWTIAGLVNTQCGLPLVAPEPGAKYLSSVQHFLPKAKCLAEYLVENGFNTVYMGGAASKFAGKGTFLRQHGFNTVRDKDDFTDWQHSGTSAIPGWGAYDDELLDRAYAEFVELSQQQAPFALFALTMDTHSPQGHISPSCSAVNYRDGKIKTLNALRCADRLVSRFINRIRSSPYYQETRLVVLSDHLAMVNDAQALIDQAQTRENLLMVFDTAVAPGERQVEATMLDVGATLLALMDADQTALGFGRSLLASRPGKGKAYTMDYYASGDVKDYLSFTRALWELPSPTAGISTSGQASLFDDIGLGTSFLSNLDARSLAADLYFHDVPQHSDWAFPASASEVLFPVGRVRISR